MAVEINIGELWQDLDYRSYYDVTPGGEYPVPVDYEGVISQRPRVVKVLDLDDNVVHVEAIHSGKTSIISRKSFYSTDTTLQGRERSQGYVRVGGGEPMGQSEDLGIVPGGYFSKLLGGGGER